MLKIRVLSTFLAQFFFFSFILLPTSQAESPSPDLSNFKYGPDQHNVLDFWKASSSKPTPVVIYIHGGGFTGGDKSFGPKVMPIADYLKAGISVASIDYRLRPVPIHDILRDCARAVQFIRYKAAELNIEKKKIGTHGDSAGASASLWLAFHSDLADPTSTDPVLKESSRPNCASANNFQYSLDVLAFESLFARMNVPLLPEFRASVNAPGFYGLKSEDDLKSPAGQKLRADCDLPSLMTKDAPPIFLACNRNSSNVADYLHHPLHAMGMKKRCDEVGINYLAIIPAFNISPPAQAPQTQLQFFIKYLEH